MKTGINADFSMICENRYIGSIFANLIVRFFERTILALLLGMAATACVVPSDIETRPMADMDVEEMEESYEYWPAIQSTVPPAGRVVLPAGCTKALFEIVLEDIPDPADPRYAQMQIRWFMDYNDDAPNIICVGGWERGIKCEINPGYYYDPVAPDEAHLLEVVISDLGFEPADVGRKSRTPVEGAGYNERSWMILIDEELPWDNPDLRCQP